MQSVCCSPGLVPYGADETVYVVVDRFFSGSACRVTESEKADLETVLSELLSGQYNCPVRVVAFNTLEHWSDDVSADVASEIEMRCDIDGLPVPDELHDFVKEHARSKRSAGHQFNPSRLAR